MSGHLSCGVIFDIIVLLIGIAFVFAITWLAAIRGQVREKYYVALIAVVTYAAFAITNYDFNKEKTDCPPFCLVYSEAQFSMCVVLASIGVAIAFLTLLVMVFIIMVKLNDIKKKLGLSDRDKRHQNNKKRP